MDEPNRCLTALILARSRAAVSTRSEEFSNFIRNSQTQGNRSPVPSTIVARWRLSRSPAVRASRATNACAITR